MDADQQQRISIQSLMSISRITVVCWLYLGLASIALAEFPVAELHSFSQAAVQKGSTIQLRPEGVHLDEASQLVVDSAGLIAIAKTSPSAPFEDAPVPTGEFEVRFDNQTLSGLYPLRVQGRFGLSNARRILVTTLPVVTPASNCTQAAFAMELASDTIFTGKFAPKERHYYRTQVSAGDRLSLRVYARQVDSRAVPNLIVYDSNGAELARSRSIGNWPAEINLEILQSQELTVVVHDFLYHGGGDFPYLFEARIAPESTSYSDLELDRILRPRWPTLESSTGLSSATLGKATFPISVFNQPARMHSLIEAPPAPLHSVQAGTNLVAPFSVRGSLVPALTPIEFEAKQGQSLSIEVRSAQLGQLTDPSLLLYRVLPGSTSSDQETLEQLIVQDDGPTLGSAAMRLQALDPFVKWIAPADGRYRIVLQDNDGGDRPTDATQYAVHVREAIPSFSLLAFARYPHENEAVARPIGNVMSRGGTLAIQVLAARKNAMTSPIEVSVSNLPEGISCPPAIIPSGSNETTLILECQSDRVEFVDELTITGTASTELGNISSVAVLAEVVWGASPTANAVRSRLTSSLGLSCSDQDVAPLLVQLGTQETLEVKAGQKLSIPITVTRRAGGESAACLLRAKNLPAKTSLGDVTIAGEKSESQAELSVAADAPAGEYTFWMLNETKVKWRENPEALSRAETHLTQLEALRYASPPEEPAQLEQAIQSQTERIKELKGRTAEKEIAVWCPTTSVRVRILPANQ